MQSTMIQTRRSHTHEFYLIGSVDNAEAPTESQAAVNAIHAARLSFEDQCSRAFCGHCDLDAEPQEQKHDRQRSQTTVVDKDIPARDQAGRRSPFDTKKAGGDSVNENPRDGQTGHIENVNQGAGETDRRVQGGKGRKYDPGFRRCSIPAWLRPKSSDTARLRQDQEVATRKSEALVDSSWEDSGDSMSVCLSEGIGRCRKFVRSLIPSKRRQLEPAPKWQDAEKVSDKHTPEDEDQIWPNRDHKSIAYTSASTTNTPKRLTEHALFGRRRQADEYCEAFPLVVGTGGEANCDSGPVYPHRLRNIFSAAELQEVQRGRSRFRRRADTFPVERVQPGSTRYRGRTVRRWRKDEGEYVRVSPPPARGLTLVDIECDEYDDGRYTRYRMAPWKVCWEGLHGLLDSEYRRSGRSL